MNFLDYFGLFSGFPGVSLDKATDIGDIISMTSQANHSEQGTKTMKTLRIGPGRYEYRSYTILKDRGEWKAKTWDYEKRRNVIIARGDTLSECKANVDLLKS